METHELDPNIVDLEEHARFGKQPARARRYRIRIDREHFVVDVAEMTGRQLLELAKKLPPEKFKVFQHLRGGETTRIELTQVVDFTTPGIERFKTLPIDSTDGLAKARRQFRMPEADEEFLERTGLRWETIIENNVKWLILYRFGLPVGYNTTLVEVALRIDSNYPSAQIDMAYFTPALSRPDGKAIPNLSSMALDGKTWQQWSRHRTAQNPWRPGEDDLQSHMLLVEDWLHRELLK